jgi:hypothetical protein
MGDDRLKTVVLMIFNMIFMKSNELSFGNDNLFLCNDMGSLVNKLHQRAGM